MNIPKNTYKNICKNQECKLEFTYFNGNRKFHSERCKRNFERDQKRKIRLKQKQDEIEMKKNRNILENYLKTGKTKVTDLELKKKGFNANHFITRIISLKGEVIYAFEGYFLHRLNDSEFIITKA
jgi:hypothetical protein